jgi:hypothetical protein
MQKGQEEQAHAILTKYHGGGDPNNALVLLEMEEMRNAIEFDRANNTEAWWDYRPLFATKSNRWRLLNPTMMACFGQVSTLLGCADSSSLAMASPTLRPSSLRRLA